MNGSLFCPFSFTEFYMLDAIGLKVRGLHEEDRWRHSIQHLSQMLDDVQPKFNAVFGRALRDYLWLSAIGEARHAHGQTKHSIPEIKRGSRESCYRDGYDYSPDIVENRDKLRSMFDDYHWSSSSYGGKKWGTIVGAIDLYYTTPMAVFIDHCADLKHNGGLAFNKNPEFWDYHDGYSEAMPLLNLKRDTDDLLYNIDKVYSQGRLKMYMTYEVSILVELAWARFDCLPYAYKRNFRGKRRYREHLLPTYDTKVFTEPLSNWRCVTCDTPLVKGETVYGNGQEICFDCADTCEHCGELVHPNQNKYYDGDINQHLCQTCRNDYTSKCNHCHERFWDINLNDIGVCRDCYEDYEPCGICGDVCSPNIISRTVTHEDEPITVCDSCGEDCTCPQCDRLWTNSDDLYTQLVLNLNSGKPKLTTSESTLCPTCVKGYLNAFQPVLKLGSGKLVIGEYQTNLYSEGIAGTPVEQSKSLSIGDLVDGNKYVGQVEMYYATKFDKLIVSH